MRVRVPLPAPNKINSIFYIIGYYASDCRTSTLPPLQYQTESMSMIQQPNSMPTEEIHKNLMEDGFKADLFFRYNPSLQVFIDNASKLV